MPYRPVASPETRAIDEVIRAWRSWARERGIDSDRPNHVSLYVFINFFAQQAERSGTLPLPGDDGMDYAERIRRAMALRGFT